MRKEPSYGMRKLSVGLVSCMIGCIIFTSPTGISAADSSNAGEQPVPAVTEGRLPVDHEGNIEIPKVITGTQDNQTPPNGTTEKEEGKNRDLATAKNEAQQLLNKKDEETRTFMKKFFNDKGDETDIITDFNTEVGGMQTSIGQAKSVEVADAYGKSIDSFCIEHKLACMVEYAKNKDIGDELKKQISDLHEEARKQNVEITKLIGENKFAEAKKIGDEVMNKYRDLDLGTSTDDMLKTAFAEDKKTIHVDDEIKTEIQKEKDNLATEIKAVNTKEAGAVDKLINLIKKGIKGNFTDADIKYFDEIVKNPPDNDEAGVIKGRLLDVLSSKNGNVMEYKPKPEDENNNKPAPNENNKPAPEDNKLTPENNNPPAPETVPEDKPEGNIKPKVEVPWTSLVPAIPSSHDKKPEENTKPKVEVPWTSLVPATSSSHDKKIEKESREILPDTSKEMNTSTSPQTGDKSDAGYTGFLAMAGAGLMLLKTRKKSKA